MLPDLKHNFHDGLIEGFQVGPRREIRIRIAYNLARQSMIARDFPLVEVRFGAIENFETVQSFFRRLEQPLSSEAYWDTIESLDYDDTKTSTSGNLHFRLDLSHGGSLKIHCGKLRMQETQ